MFNALMKLGSIFLACKMCRLLIWPNSRQKVSRKSDDILNLSLPYLEIDWLITLSPAYFLHQFLSSVARKPVFGFLTGSDINWAMPYSLEILDLERRGIVLSI